MILLRYIFIGLCLILFLFPNLVLGQRWCDNPSYYYKDNDRDAYGTDEGISDFHYEYTKTDYIDESYRIE